MAYSKEQKRLRTDALQKKKDIPFETSKALKLEQAKKTKLDSPGPATMESILSHYEIRPARYHGGLSGIYVEGKGNRY